MSLIIGYAEILQSYEADEESKAWMLKNILDSSRNLSEQIDQMLDLAAIDARIHSHTYLETIDVFQALADACARFDFPSDQRRPILLGSPGDYRCKGNALLLVKCFNELLTNAFQYSFGHGSIRLNTDINNVGFYRITIEDDGIGMSLEEANMSTARFWRADKSGKSPGIGLGLAIVKEVISLHGGQLNIVSVVGKGTRISVLLPPLL